MLYEKRSSNYGRRFRDQILAVQQKESSKAVSPTVPWEKPFSTYS